MAEQLITVAEGLHRWWTKPPPSSLLPKPTAPGKSAEDKRSASRTVPPFDIQQIPDAMDRLRLPVSARMMRHWFAGRANYSRTNDDLIAGIDQDGKPYAPDIIDQRIIDFDWVMQFARARKAHDELLPELIHSPKSLAKIADKVLAYMACRIRPFSAFNGLSVSNKNVHELHRDFQFQFVGVDSTFVDKALKWAGHPTRSVSASARAAQVSNCRRPPGTGCSPGCPECRSLAHLPGRDSTQSASTFASASLTRGWRGMTVRPQAPTPPSRIFTGMRAAPSASPR